MERALTHHFFTLRLFTQFYGPWFYKESPHTSFLILPPNLASPTFYPSLILAGLLPCCLLALTYLPKYQENLLPPGESSRASTVLNEQTTWVPLQLSCSSHCTHVDKNAGAKATCSTPDATFRCKQTRPYLPASQRVWQQAGNKTLQLHCETAGLTVYLSPLRQQVIGDVAPSSVSISSRPISILLV